MRQKIEYQFHHVILDPDEEDEFTKEIGMEFAPIKYWCGRQMIHIRFKGLFGMNWSKKSKMNLLKLIKFGFITRITLDQDTFEDYADLIGGRFNPDMEEFLNLLYPGLSWTICDGLTDYLQSYPHHGYWYPRIEYYPLEHNWKAEVKLQNMEICLRPALLAVRVEKDIAYSNDYMVQIHYAFNATSEDWEKACTELPDELMDPIPFGS